MILHLFSCNYGKKPKLTGIKTKKKMRWCFLFVCGNFQLSVESYPDCIGFSLLRSVIGPKHSRHFLSQSDVITLPITTWPSAFSRVFPRFGQFALVFLYFALGLVQKIRATLSTNQMQTKTNHDLVARVFPRFGLFAWFYFEFLLAL